MATIGTFTKSGNEFVGEIITFNMQAKNVRFVPNDARGNDKSPAYRVLAGRAEIGAAWSERSKNDVDYHSVKLDDPSFAGPIYANLFEGEGGEYQLVWNRGRKQNGD
jgi:uncharacterized protein (DUF736 family)